MKGDVPAPLGAVGWSISRGWITDPQDLITADAQARDLVYAVPDDRIVRDVVGFASTASLMHLDTRVLALQREIVDLRDRLFDVAESMVDRLAARE